MITRRLKITKTANNFTDKLPINKNFIKKYIYVVQKNDK